MTPPPGSTRRQRVLRPLTLRRSGQCPQEVSHVGRLQESSNLVEGVRGRTRGCRITVWARPELHAGQVSVARHGPPVSCLLCMDWSTFDQGAHQRSIDNRLGALPALVQGLTILVVDDDDLVLDSTRIILEDLGARVLTARDGADALDRLAAHTPDLVLSDLAMPEMDGYQLVARVRSDPARASLPMIAVSAHASPADSARILRAGFDAQVGKPFDYADLAEAFKSAMRRLPSLYNRQRDRLRAFATKQRLKARALRQRSRFVLGRTHTLSGTGLPCRCGASAETLWRCADCARRCCPECAFRSDGVFYCPTCADRRLTA